MIELTYPEAINPSLYSSSCGPRNPLKEGRKGGRRLSRRRQMTEATSEVAAADPLQPLGIIINIEVVTIKLLALYSPNLPRKKNNQFLKAEEPSPSPSSALS